MVAALGALVAREISLAAPPARFGQEVKCLAQTDDGKAGVVDVLADGLCKAKNENALGTKTSGEIIIVHQVT